LLFIFIDVIAIKNMRAVLKSYKQET
jgi:hypothetical protein